MLERHRNVSGRARTAAAACTRTQRSRQVMAVKEAQGAQRRWDKEGEGDELFFVQLTRELIRRKLHRGEIHISAL